MIVSRVVFHSPVIPRSLCVGADRAGNDYLKGPGYHSLTGENQPTSPVTGGGQCCISYRSEVPVPALAGYLSPVRASWIPPPYGGVRVEVSWSFLPAGRAGEAAPGAAGAQEGAAAPAGGGRLKAEREVTQAGHSRQSHQGPDRGDNPERPAAAGECRDRFGVTTERP